MRSCFSILMLSCLALLPAPAVAAAPTGASSGALGAMERCRTVADVTARAECFDRELAALEAAVAGGSVVLIDREGMRKARQSLFGLSLPSLAFLNESGSGNSAGHPPADEMMEVHGTVRSVGRDQDGRWILVLDDNATWHQMSDAVLGRAPRTGDAVVIRRAAFGSYMLRVGTQPGFKAQRDR